MRPELPPPGCPGLNLEGKVDDLRPPPALLPGLGEVVAPTNPGVEGKNGVTEKKLRREIYPPSYSSSQGRKWSAIRDGEALTGLSYL